MYVLIFHVLRKILLGVFLLICLMLSACSSQSVDKDNPQFDDPEKQVFYDVFEWAITSEEEKLEADPRPGPTVKREKSIVDDSDKRAFHDVFEWATSLKEEKMEADPRPGSKFGKRGVIKTTIGYGDDEARGLAIQPDGKMILVGYSLARGTRRDFTLARFNPDGSLDGTFGKGGKVKTDFGSGADQANAVALQPDGKIVVAGFRTGVDEDFAIARYNKDGTLDRSFGYRGRVITDLGSSRRIASYGKLDPYLAVNDVAQAIAIQPDGRIVVAGYTSVRLKDYSIVVRYLRNGRIDSTFGKRGRVITSLGDIGSQFTSVLVQPDGRIVAGGYADKMEGSTQDQNLSNSEFALVRFESNGLLDRKFGHGGKMVVKRRGSDDRIEAIALRKDGKIIAAGSTDSNGLKADFIVARFKSNGALDGSFGKAGSVTTPVSTQAKGANAIHLQDDGKIIAVGTAKSGSNLNFALVRYLESGALDSAFGRKGIVITPVSSTTDSRANAVAVQSDGKIVVAGATQNGGFGYDFALVRYHPNGTLDN